MDISWWHLALFILEFAVRLSLVVFILLRRQPGAAASLAWITIILIIPVGGIIAYLLVGEARLSRRRVRRHRDIIERVNRPGTYTVTVATDHSVIAPQFRAIETLGESVGNSGALGGNELQLIGDTDLFIDTLVNDIHEAQVHCHLLFYIFLDDHSGQRVGEALMEAAGRGVETRVLVDAVGSRPFLSCALRRRMEAAGVRVVAALPANTIRLLFARLDLRNHRKIVVIDNAIAYMGSHNLADAAFAVKPKFAPWVDAMVRVHGPVARDLHALFIEDWYLDTDESLVSMLSTEPAPRESGMMSQVMGTGPNSDNEALVQVLLCAFHAAREELIMTTPYFVPDPATAMAIQTAARRGVATTLIVPARNDSPLVAAASRSHYETLLDAGVRIFEFQKGLLHAKTVSIDRDLAVISSANLDRRSFELNFEVSMVVYDSDFASELRFLQTSYLEDSTPINPGQWRQRGWPRRLWQNTAGLVSPLL